MIDPGLRGRGVLITGANNRLGIGAAIARGFARLGATVFLHYHQASLQRGIQVNAYRAEQAKSADEILKDLRNIGGQAAAFEADFSDLSTISRLFDAAEHFRHVARGATWGRIVNISTAGSECFPSEASYGASKYALESYTRAAAQELGQFGSQSTRWRSAQCRQVGSLQRSSRRCCSRSRSTALERLMM